jgi:hypothetical protein
MTQTLGSEAKVKWDRPKDRLNPAQMDRDILRILDLLTDIRHVWEQAVDGGAYPGRTGSGGRGTGFTDLKPTESAVFAPTQRQLRQAAREATTEVGTAIAHLELAADICHRGLLRTDPEVYARDLEKRQAAEQGRP